MSQSAAAPLCPPPRSHLRLERWVQLVRKSLQVRVALVVLPPHPTPVSSGDPHALSACLSILQSFTGAQALGTELLWLESPAAWEGDGSLQLEFIAAVPLISRSCSHPLGHLWIADAQPRSQTIADVETLQEWAEVIADGLDTLPPPTHLQDLQVLLQDLDAQNQRIRAEYQALERQCQRWQQLAQTPLAEILTDPTGEICWVNPRAADLLGHSLPQLQGRSWFSFLSPTDRDRWQAQLPSLTPPAAPQPCPPLRLRIQRCLTPPLSLWISPIALESGPGWRWTLLPPDPSALDSAQPTPHLAEEVTQPDSALWLHRILDQSTEMVIVFNAQGHLVEVNQTACQTLLYSRAELLDRTLSDLDSLWPQAYQEIFHTPSPSPLRRTSAWTRKDTSSLWVDLSIRPLTWQGHSFGVLSARLHTHAQPLDLEEKRQRYLSAVVEVQQHLLEAKSHPWDEAFYLQLLQPLGQASGATQLYVFQNYRDGSGRLCMIQRAEWSAVADPASSSPIRELPYEQFSSDWLEALQRGEIRGGIVAEGDSSAQRLSTLILPLLVQGEFWGFISFDSPVLSWPESYEIDLLRATAAAIALTLERNQAEADYRSIYENAVEGIFQASLEGRFLTANPAMARILGYSSPDELIHSITHIDAHLVHPEQRLERLHQLETTGVLAGVEFQTLRKDGTPIWVEVNARGVRDHQGRLLYVEGFAQDISARKQALAALEESELRFRQLAENTHQLFWILDPRSGQLLYVSPTCQQVWGQSLEQVQSSPQAWIEWVHPEDRDPMIRARAAQSQGERTELLYRILRSDIGLRWIQERAFPITNAQGEIYRVAGWVEDITDRRRREQALRESEALLRTLVDHLPFDVWACDDQDRYILQKSPSEHRIEMESKVEELNLATESLESWQKLTSRVQTGEVVQAEVHQLAEDEPRTFFKILAPILDQDQFRGLVGVSIDITERKQMEQALRQSEEHFRQIFELAPNGMAIFGLSGELLRVNGAFCQILGCTPEQMLTLGIRDLCTAEDATSILNQMQSLQQGEISHTQLERRLRHQQTGQVITVIWRMTLVRDPQQRPLHVLSQILDITDRKQAEKALRKSQEKYKTLFEAFPIGLSITDDQGSVIETNPASASLLNLSSRRRHPLQAQAAKLIWPDGRPLTSADLPTVKPLREQQTVDYPELGIRQRGGEVLWLRVTATPMPLEGYGVAMAFSDITEHKRAEDALRESELRFRAVFEQTALGISLADPEGRYLSTNPALQAMLGYRSEDLRGRQFSEFSLPDQADQDWEIYHELVRGRRSHYRVEHRYLRQDGQPIWCRLTVSSVRNSQGDLQFTIGVVEDITEQKRSELRIQAALQEKEILLREIHHRVKNNLQIISSLLRLQSESIKSRKYLRIFRDAWSRIESMSLIHEELYQARDLSKVNLLEYIQGLAAKLFHSYGIDTDRIRLQLNIEQIELSIDAGVICGLILNELLTNSLKYAFPDQRSGCITLTLQQDQTQTRLQVQDDGIGIPADFDWAETDSLGLQLVSTLTEQLEGTIELDRIAGTTFTIVFPRSRS